MRILVDMDGVIADFLEHWCYVFNRRYNRDVQPFEIMTWSMHESIPGATREQCEDLIWEPGFFLHLKPIYGAIDTLEKLHREGHEVVFLTACLAGHADKLVWLKHRFSFPIKVIFTSEKYMVKGDVFLDDNQENLKAWANEWPEGKAVCFSTPYNKGWDGYRVYDWKGFNCLLPTLENQTDANITD